ncbi:MAG: response regulator [Anaerolineae bacterium]|nr:response regulator [Anaerolineae bacterium]
MQSEMRALIAEDETLVSEMLYGLLDEMGYAVAGRALDGVQAVDMVQRMRPDFVLMDIEMPGIDGIEAARQIRDGCPTPVIVLTSYERPELVEQASAAGVGAYLVKPPNARELDRAITIAIARFDDMIRLRRLNTEIEKALEQVKQLSGLLPICANCKKIRDDTGYWQDVAVYIRNHSEAEFSHGLCPDCAQELYPDLFDQERLE